MIVTDPDHRFNMSHHMHVYSVVKYFHASISYICFKLIKHLKKMLNLYVTVKVHSDVIY